MRFALYRPDGGDWGAERPKGYVFAGMPGGCPAGFHPGQVVDVNGRKAVVHDVIFGTDGPPHEGRKRPGIGPGLVLKLC